LGKGSVDSHGSLLFMLQQFGTGCWLVRTKANLYIPSDLCHIYVGYCGSIAVVELNLMDISGHLYSMSRYLVTLLWITWSVASLGLIVLAVKSCFMLYCLFHVLHMACCQGMDTCQPNRNFVWDGLKSVGIKPEEDLVTRVRFTWSMPRNHSGWEWFPGNRTRPKGNLIHGAGNVNRQIGRPHSAWA